MHGILATHTVAAIDSIAGHPNHPTKPWPTTGRLLAEALRRGDRETVLGILAEMPTPAPGGIVNGPVDRQRLTEVAHAMRACQVPFTAPAMHAPVIRFRSNRGTYVDPDLQLRPAVLKDIRDREDPIDRADSAGRCIQEDAEPSTIATLSSLANQSLYGHVATIGGQLTRERNALFVAIAGGAVPDEPSTEPKDDFMDVIASSVYGPFLLKGRLFDAMWRGFALAEDSSIAEVYRAQIDPTIDRTIAHDHPGFALASLDAIFKRAGGVRGLTKGGQPITPYPLSLFQLVGNEGSRNQEFLPVVWKLQVPGFKRGTTLETLFARDIGTRWKHGCPGAVDPLLQGFDPEGGRMTAAQWLSALYGSVCGGPDFLDYSMTYWTQRRDELAAEAAIAPEKLFPELGFATGDIAASR